MKYLLMILLCFSLHVSASDETPPANAFKGNVHGYEIAVFLNQIFPAEYGIRALYFNEGSWHYLSEPSCFVSQIETKEDADYCFQTSINEINQQITAVLTPISTEPDNGIARLQWLIQNKLKIEDDQLVFVQ